MKVHPILVSGVIRCLESIFGDGRYADKAVEYTLKANPKWGARDRAFVAESVYEIVRHWRRLWWLYGKDVSLQEQDLWRLFGIYLLDKGINLPPFDAFKGLKPENYQNKSPQMRAIRYSLPDWMDTLAANALPEIWDKEIEALNRPAELILRVNTLKTTREKLAAIFAEQGIETRTLDEAPDALILEKRINVFSQPSFQAGLFEVQDASSQLVAPFLGVENGMRVIDACAGAGGKSLHLAALMKNKGRLLSMDIEQYKLQELKRRAARAGINMIEPRLIENSKTIKRLEASAERVLLDVPCSGLGVLRRNPDAKWKLKPEFIQEIQLTQQDILTRYSRMVAPQGILVYATCSILPQENRLQVEKFLEKSEGKFSLIEDKAIFASDFGFDGFYMAKLKRNA